MSPDVKGTKLPVSEVVGEPAAFRISPDKRPPLCPAGPHSSAEAMAQKTVIQQRLFKMGSAWWDCSLYPTSSRVETTRVFLVLRVLYCMAHTLACTCSLLRRTRRPDERGMESPTERLRRAGPGWAQDHSAVAAAATPGACPQGDWIWGSLGTPAAPQAQPSPLGPLALCVCRGGGAALSILGGWASWSLPTRCQ